MMVMPRLNILVADDDPPSLELAQIILEAEGHRVTACRDGAEVVARLLEHGETFDLLLLDVVMPHVDGLTATATLRERPDTQGLPIICTSASANLAAREAGRLVGCTYYLIKPYRRADLLDAIAEVMNERP